jgi:predicted ATP-dependent serine protease
VQRVRDHCAASLFATNTTKLAGGVPGIGKTQLSMQAVLDVQIPAELGGIDGEAVYLDTEGSLMPARIAQMATALESHLQALVQVSEVLFTCVCQFMVQS